MKEVWGGQGLEETLEGERSSWDGMECDGMEPGAPGQTRDNNLVKMRNWSKMDNTRP